METVAILHEFQLTCTPRLSPSLCWDEIQAESSPNLKQNRRTRRSQAFRLHGIRARDNVLTFQSSPAVPLAPLVRILLESHVRTFHFAFDLRYAISGLR